MFRKKQLKRKRKKPRIKARRTPERRAVQAEKRALERRYHEVRSQLTRRWRRQREDLQSLSRIWIRFVKRHGSQLSPPLKLSKYPKPSKQLLRHPVFLAFPRSAELILELAALDKKLQNPFGPKRLEPPSNRLMYDAQLRVMDETMQRYRSIFQRWTWLYDTRNKYYKKLTRDRKRELAVAYKALNAAEDFARKLRPRYVRLRRLLLQLTRAFAKISKAPQSRTQFVLYNTRLRQFDLPRALSVKLLYDHFGAGPELRRTWWTVFYEHLLSFLLFLFALSMPVHLLLIFYCRWQLGGLSLPEGGAK